MKVQTMEMPAPTTSSTAPTREALEPNSNQICEEVGREGTDQFLEVENVAYHTSWDFHHKCTAPCNDDSERAEEGY